MRKICLVILMAFMMVITPVQASNTNIDEMTITATLDELGNAHIKEIWEMNVYEGTEVYKIMNNMNEKRITNLKVTDENNNQYTNIGEWDVSASKEEKRNKCGLVNDGDDYELCFGIGDYGHRTYTFEYDVSYFVEQYNGDQGFNFAFFSELELDIEKVRITIEYPSYQFSEDNSDIYAYGYEGYIVYNKGRIVMGNEGILNSGSNKMQILMRIDNGTFKNLVNTGRTFDDILEEAEDDGLGFGFFILMTVVVLAFVFLIVVLVMNKTEEEMFENGDKLEIDDNNIPIYNNIPSHGDLFRFYFLARKIYLKNEKKYLIDTEEQSGLISGIILKWVRDGVLEFEKIEGTPGLFGKSEGFAVDMYNKITIDNPLEQELLEFIKDASGMNMKFEDGEFERWCRKHYTLIDEWFLNVEKSVEESLKQEGLIRVNQKIYKHFGKINDKYKEIVYTDTLKEEMYQIIGFKKYLEEISMSYIENIDIKQWEEYLIYANILDIADNTEKIIKKKIPDFVEYSHINPYYHPHLIRTFSHKGVQAAHTASSSSSTGGGGSFSGGGGGGVR